MVVGWWRPRRALAVGFVAGLFLFVGIFAHGQFMPSVGSFGGYAPSFGNGGSNEILEGRIVSHLKSITVKDAKLVAIFHVTENEKEVVFRSIRDQLMLFIGQFPFRWKILFEQRARGDICSSRISFFLVSNVFRESKQVSTAPKDDFKTRVEIDQEVKRTRATGVPEIHQYGPSAVWQFLKVCEFPVRVTKTDGWLLANLKRIGLLDDRISHGGYLLMSEASVDDGGNHSRARDESCSFLPTDLEFPISFLLGAMLIIAGGRVCWYAWDVDSDFAAFALVLVGWVFLDGGLLLIFVTLGV
jgi:hypothetical protein